MSMPRTNLIGRTFDKLLVLGYAPPDSRGKTQFKCICKCGNRVVVTSKNLLTSGTRSCGCLKSEPRKHGMSKTPTHQCWLDMRHRCSNPNNPYYHRYGARGIKVCKRWDDFAKFLEDMGPKPPRHSLDRINNDGDYKPSNCRWATPTQQNDNLKHTRWLTVDGVTLTRREASIKYGISKNTLIARLLKGWSDEDACKITTQRIGARSKV